MALNALGLGLLFTAKDLATGVMSKVRNGFAQTRDELGRFGPRSKQAFEQFGTGVKIATAGLGILAGTALLASKTIPFEEALSSLRAVTGATAEEMERLEAASIKAGLETQFDPTQAATALGDLAQAGFNVNESIGLLKPTLDLAAGSLGKLTPSQAAGLASQAMKAFGIEVEGASLAVDQMLQGINVFALSAEELPLALGTAARGAGSLNQSLAETMVALGLVKNVVPGVERASTSVAVAMERMVDPKVQQALKAKGAAVVDTTGKFRPFLDILGDMVPALSKMTEAQRAAFLQDTFGAEALGGINAILGQMQTGIKTTSGEVLKGGAALDYLRAQFENAGGTAKRFSDELLNSFPGQIKLLEGSISTLAIVLGKPFAKAWRPIIETVLSGVNRILEVVQGMPEPVKNAMAKAVIAFGAIVAVIGAVVSAKAAVVIFAAALKVAGVSLLGLVKLMAPAIAIIALLGLTIYAFKRAVDRDLDGIGGRFFAFVDGVKLAWDALMQLFTQGGFSGAVREEFLKGENPFINFAIKVYLIANRIKVFLSSLVESFTSAIEELDFATLEEALGDLGAAIGLVSNDATASGEAFDAWANAGGRVGVALGKVIEVIVATITAAVQIVTGFIEVWGELPDVFGPIGESFGDIGEAIEQVLGSLGVMTGSVQEGGSGWKVFGGILANVVAAAVRGVGRLIRAIANQIQDFATVVSGVVDIIAGIFTGDWARVWNGMKMVVFGVVQGILDSMFALADGTAATLDSIASLAGYDLGASKTIQGLRDKQKTWFADAMGIVPGAASGQNSSQPILNTPDPIAAFSPAESPVLASGLGPNASVDPAALGDAAAKAATAAMKGAPALVVRAVLTLPDGSVIAEAVSKAQTSSDARSFTPSAPVSE